MEKDRKGCIMDALIALLGIEYEQRNNMGDIYGFTASRSDLLEM